MKDAIAAMLRSGALKGLDGIFDESTIHNLLDNAPEFDSAYDVDGGCSCDRSCDEEPCEHTYRFVKYLLAELTDPASSLPARLTGVATKVPQVAALASKPVILEELDQFLASRPAAQDEGDDDQSPAVRLAWKLEIDHNGLGLVPLKQRPKKQGNGWTKGHRIALETLWHSPELTTSPVDAKVVQAIRQQATSRYRYSYYDQTEWVFDMVEAVDALVGHELVLFHDEPVEVQRFPFGIRVSEQTPDLLLTITFPVESIEGLRVSIYRNGIIARSSTRPLVMVCRCDEAQSVLAKSLINTVPFPRERLGDLQLRLNEISATAAPIIQDLLDAHIDFDAPKAWRDCLSRLDSAQKLDPDPPESFDGTLRDYQLEGYRWLRRLAEWSVGGCLADDMGLGKTIQALAVLIDRQQIGPALVVAPTSVGFNWVRETERFAPDLQAHLYRETDRAAFLENVGEGDLVVCSYGLALRDADALGKVHWGTLILDEAQFIKNSRAKTSQAIRTFRADWKLALTGTPMENHLGELWSIFRNVSPGLFGNWEGFRDRFARPIEKDNDEQRRAVAPNPAIRFAAIQVGSTERTSRAHRHELVRRVERRGAPTL